MAERTEAQHVEEHVAAADEEHDAGHLKTEHDASHVTGDPETEHHHHGHHERRKCTKKHEEDEEEEDDDEEDEDDDCYTYDGSETSEAHSDTLVPAAIIHSGCHLNRDALLVSLKKVQKFVAETDAASRTDVRFITQLGGLVGVLKADMENLRAYCQRATVQLEAVREPIKDLTGKIFQKLPSEIEAEAARKAHEAALAALEAAEEAARLAAKHPPNASAETEPGAEDPVAEVEEAEGRKQYTILFTLMSLS